MLSNKRIQTILKQQENKENVQNEFNMIKNATAKQHSQTSSSTFKKMPLKKPTPLRDITNTNNTLSTSTALKNEKIHASVLKQLESLNTTANSAASTTPIEYAPKQQPRILSSKPDYLQLDESDIIRFLKDGQYSSLSRPFIDVVPEDDFNAEADALFSSLDDFKPVELDSVPPTANLKTLTPSQHKQQELLNLFNDLEIIPE